jgi:hypothetical protein
MADAVAPCFWKPLEPPAPLDDRFLAVVAVTGTRCRLKHPDGGYRCSMFLETSGTTRGTTRAAARCPMFLETSGTTRAGTTLWNHPRGWEVGAGWHGQGQMVA